jgi:subtilisin family serine protease
VFPPARWEPVIAVGATDNKDIVASFTTTGPELDVSAPGVNVYSCWDAIFQTNTYSYQSGTSMACPHVAGLACLVWSANRALDNEGVRAIIESTAEDRGAAGWDPIYGHGRVNAFNAVSLAVESQCVAEDLNCDGDVDGADFGLLLVKWS